MRWQEGERGIWSFSSMVSKGYLCQATALLDRVCDDDGKRWWGKQATALQQWFRAGANGKLMIHRWIN